MEKDGMPVCGGRSGCPAEPVLFLALAGLLTAAIAGCTKGDNDADSELEANWSALMADGDTSAIAPGPMGPASGTPQPPRFCIDCTRVPLALWTFDDCNQLSTELADTAFTTSLSHPAFRAVSAACATGIDGQAVKLAGKDDIIYAPDQPDFLFDQGLTVAAFINPDSLNGTQSIVRKRFAGQSAFTLAIDGRKLVFVLHLTNGRNLAVTAPIQARRFTHVAATYDDHDARLYLDGLLAAQAHAPGKIAAGAGPILIGNDADGRQMKGTIDSVWLNTLAAPADAILGLTCVRKPPIVSLSPSETPPQVAGTAVAFDLSITNASGPTCPSDPFPFFISSLPPQLTPDSFSGAVLAAPGETAHGLFSVKSSRMASVGAYTFEMFVFDVNAQQLTATASATYVVGTGPVACDGAPPSTDLIVGSPFSPAGAPFTYAATGLNPPNVVPVNDANGFTQALQVSLNPGVTSDPANAFLGFGFGFGNPPCLDASAFTGVRFTITGDLGTCGLAFSLAPSQDNSVAFGPFGTCTLDNCLAPSTAPIGTGTTVVHFSDLTGGNPLPTLDPTALNAISWNATPPTDGVTAPCVANFTVSDIAFVNDGPLPPP
jgi:Concanavalin A-like lectin/glucanases superfamily